MKNQKSSSCFLDIRNILTLVLSSTCLIAANSSLAESVVPLPRASITAADLGVIIIDGDATSEAIGAYYQSARSIPAANIVRIKLPVGYGVGSSTIPASEFAVLKSQVDNALPANVQATLITWTKPYRVQGGCNMSITSAFAFGYNDTYCNWSTTTGVSNYYDSESTTPWQDFGIRPSMMLGASNFTSAKALIDRGIAADGTYPAGDGYLIKTTDSNRSVRFFSGLPELWNYSDGLKLNYIDNTNGTIANDYISGKNNVLFYFTGLENVPNISSNSFLPGAIADHLTSYGGDLSNPNQMKATMWLEAGATASFGTVEEPSGNTNKFPDASIAIDHYYRGSTLIEAYWKSVRNPGQGLFLGEPLARPFADKPTSSVVGSQYVLSTRELKRDSIYKIQYRETATGSWINHTSILSGLPMQREYRAPIVSASASEIRLDGPCPNIKPIDSLIFQGSSTLPSLSSDFTVQAQGGRSQRVYFKVLLKNNQAKSSCSNNINVQLSTSGIPNGLIAQISPSTLNLQPQEYAEVLVTVDVSSSIAQTSNEINSFSIKATNTDDGSNKLSPILQINSRAGTSKLKSKLMTIMQPNINWGLRDYPERTSQYEFPMEVDVNPNSNIWSVEFELVPVVLDDGTEETASHIVKYTDFSIDNNSVLKTTLNTKLIADNLSSGIYQLNATGRTEEGLTVFIDTVYPISISDQVKTLSGSSSIDNIVGDSGNDILIGRVRGDNLTGGGGNNIFSYNRLNEGLDVINDFVPGKDRIDLTNAFANIGYAKFSPAVKSLVRIISTSDGAQIQVRAMPDLQFNPLATLKGVAIEDVNLDRDLQLVPRMHLFAQ